MNKTAHIIIVLLAVVFINVAALALPKSARAATGNVQICEQDSNCTVGEFLYDDNYTPISTASCSFKSRYPNGTIFVNSQPMTTALENDGWYSYNVSATGSAGIYRSTICCTVGGEYLCLDKSFEVSSTSAGLSANDISNSVWNAPRSLYSASGTFGEALQNIVPSANEIAAAIWGYSGRSLTTFGTLAADVWSYTSRLITGASLSSGSLATKSDVDSKVDAKTQELKNEITKVQTSSTDITDLKKSSQRTNALLEQLVNKPIVETSVEDVPDLQAKLKDTQSIVTNLFVNSQSVNSKMGLMKLKWNSLNNGDILDGVQEIIGKMGGENDSATSGSIIGYISALRNSWDWSNTETIGTQAKTIRDVLISIQKDIESSGKSKTTYNKVVAVNDLFDKLGDSVGSSSDTSNQNTLFGKLKQTKLLASSLDRSTGDFEIFLKNWDTYKLSEKQTKLATLTKTVASVNKIPSINKSLLSTNLITDKELKNKSYFAMGIISANKKLLAEKSGATLTNTWLELGSIVFKTLVSNPSSVISQKATLKYYLPPELKEEDIIEADKGLSVKYDTEKNQYYVTGEFLLAPSETKTLSVRTQDIWVISRDKVDSLRKQADELSRPLENTSYFAQGVTIKSQIDVSLDKVLELMNSNTTPEVKIRAYREAQIELRSVSDEMDALKELVTQAGSTGTLFGFVGGAQALAVWGLIIMLSLGFVFLALYMKVLVKHEKKDTVKKQTPKEKKAENKNKEIIIPKPLPRFRHAYYVILMLSGIGISLASGIVLGRTTLGPNSQQKMMITKAGNVEVLHASASADLIDTEKTKDNKKEMSQTIKVVVPKGDVINIRKEASTQSKIVYQIRKTSEFKKLNSKDGWVEIISEGNKEDVEVQGFVSEEFVEEQGQDKSEEVSATLDSYKVVVNDDFTDFLRVRQSPEGEVIAKIYPGATFNLLGEEEDWFKIELEDGGFGWVSKEFTTKSNL